MCLRCHSRTAARIHCNLHRWKRCFEDQSIRYHADIRAKSDHLNLLKRSFIPVRPSESRLINVSTAFYFQTICDLPSLCSLDAVHNRKLFALRCVQIITLVRISRKDDLIPSIFVLLDFFLYIRHDCLCFFRS